MKNKYSKFTIIVAFIILIIVGATLIYKINISMDLERCYEAINDDYDYEKFKQIVSKHSSQNFSKKAYEELNRALDEQNYILMNGKIDNNTRFKIIKLLSTIERDSFTPEEQKNIIKSKQNYCDYYYLISYGKSQEENNIIVACNSYVKALKIAEEENDNNSSEKAKSKIEETEEKALSQLKIELNKYIENQDYAEGYSKLLHFSDLIEYSTDEEIKLNYKLLESKDADIQSAKKEEKANEIKKQTEIEESLKKDQLIVDTNGKQIYKVYMNSNIFKINGNYSGNGYFGIELLDSNQDLYKLLANEIGDFIVDKSVAVTKGKYYYIKIECTKGEWNLEWTGTYGK